MKILLLALGIAVIPAALNAQTNSSASATNDVIAKLMSEAPSTNTDSTNIVLRPPTIIRSDTGTFDMKTRLLVYTGHVHVDDPQMKLTCDVLTASVPESGHPDHIVAEHNVVIDAVDNQGKPIHATSDKAIYNYKVENSVTNEIVKLIGNPLVLSASNSIAGDEITWNRADGQIHVTNPIMTGRQNFIEPSTTKPASSVNATNTP